MSKIRFPDNLDMSKEDIELFANLAQLELNPKSGKKEYVINYQDENGKTQTVALDKLNDLTTSQLEQIKKQIRTEQTRKIRRERGRRRAKTNITET